MQKFETATEVNFVDEANVFLGYSLQSDCCESPGYLVTRHIPTSTEDAQIESDADLSGFLFDTEFVQYGSVEGLDEGGSATFRATRGDGTIYVTLYNSQNGYYGHGFEFKVNGAVKIDGGL
jgi:hypothetical protein